MKGEFVQGQQSGRGNGHCISIVCASVKNLKKTIGIRGMRSSGQHSCGVAYKCCRNRPPFTENSEQEWLGHLPHSILLSENSLYSSTSQWSM